MRLGWCDVCLRVGNVEVTRAFYEKLGFWRVEGDDSEGWAVLTNGDQRLGLFVEKFMSNEFSINFRGGDIRSICDDLEARGIEFSKPPVFVDGGGSASIVDPDGHAIFLDAMPGEVKLLDPI